MSDLTKITDAIGVASNESETVSEVERFQVLATSGYQIASHFGIQSPDSIDSPGSKWLKESVSSAVTYALDLLANQKDRDEFESVASDAYDDAIESANTVGYPTWTNESLSIYSDLWLHQETDEMVSEYGSDEFESALERINATIFYVLERIYRDVFEALYSAVQTDTESMATDE